MKKLVSTFSDTKQNSVIWGEFRFAVIGQLIVSHIDRGQIGTEIKRLSERTWKHPIYGQDTTFSSATIERWYYRALNASSNPILALGPLRSDSGSHRALSNDGYSYLHKQFQSHKQWGYRKLYNRLEEFSKKRYWLSLPNYSTVRRYLIYMEQLPDHEPNRKAKKLDSLVCHLRRCLITQSVRLHLFEVSHQKNNIGRSLQSLHNLESTKKQYVLDRLQDYKRAGGNKSTYCQFTGISPSTILRWSRVYKQHGLSGLVPMKRRKYSNQIKAQQTKLRVLEIFHNQPRIYGINRSSWSGKSLAKAFQREYRESISAGTARRHLRKSGYTMRRARQVLTSTDPEYRQKVELLIRTLRSLRPDEVLFFIDEMGPMRVKKYGGRIYTKKGSTKTFPQVQANKGSVTLSGALCATTNQMTWIYGKSKNTSAMIDLIEVLFNQYIDKSRIYITWDAASWHSSDQLVSWLDKFNEGTNLTGAGPIVDFIPLPACAQFLDIIEAVFGGMKKAVIHHSDYATEKEMKVAISRHFEERNEYFKENPRRAGKKIWSIDFFSDYEHLRSGNYREW